MKSLFAIAFVLVSAPAFGQAPGAERCPVLPRDSGFEWHYEAGIDFYLCRAQSTSGGPQFFGMYLGFAANFHPEKGAQREKGIVGGYDVIWYGTRSEDRAYIFGRETLFDLPRTSDGYSPEVHVWIYAVTAEQLVGMMHVLENVEFKGTF